MKYTVNKSISGNVFYIYNGDQKVCAIHQGFYNDMQKASDMADTLCALLNKEVAK